MSVSVSLKFWKSLDACKDQLNNKMYMLHFKFSMESCISVEVYPASVCIFALVMTVEASAMLPTAWPGPTVECRGFD